MSRIALLALIFAGSAAGPDAGGRGGGGAADRPSTESPANLEPRVEELLHRLHRA